MESGQHEEDWKDSSEESDRPETVSDETGTGRFYECMFCKRGFSTAQALGGHMNIHRRDRARIRQQTPPSVSSRPGNDPPNPGFLPQSSYNSIAPDGRTNHCAYAPGSTSSTRHIQMFHGDNPSVRMPPRQLSLFGEELNVGPSARVGPARAKDGEEEKKHWEDGELDLELRLGHEP